MSDVRRPQFGAAKPSRFARMRRGALAAALTIAIAMLVALQLRGVDAGTNPSIESWPVMPPATARVDVGLTTLPLAQNAFRRWKGSDLETVNAWEQMIRKHASVVMWYADWTTPPPPRRQLDAIAARRSTPEITWEPWRSFHVPKPVRHQPTYRLRNIIDGRFDAYIRTWAKALAAYRRPVRLRFAQEMNGNWYPWSESANGNRRGEFVRAWRHVYTVFRRAGATNVQWVWSPAAINMSATQYPGDRYVTFVGLTAFNGGAQLRYTRWHSFAWVVGGTLRRLHAIAPEKPVELSEVGCAEKGGSKAKWIAEMFVTLKRHPEIRSLLWFDVVKWSDWRVGSSVAAAEAFAAGVADSRYR